MRPAIVLTDTKADAKKIHFHLLRRKTTRIEIDWISVAMLRGKDYFCGKIRILIMKRLKGILAGQAGSLQIVMLLSLIVIGAVLSSSFAVFILQLLPGASPNLQNPDALRWIQLCSSIGTFLFPPLVMAWLCSTRPKEYLFIDESPQLYALLLVMLSVFLITPFITLTGLLNQQMALPSFMEPVERWMREQEDLAEKITGLLLEGEGLLVFSANFLVIVIAAAVTEEFLFRGVLFRLFEKWIRNRHVIIWVGAILFSAFHMQFYGFIPRMLLGAYFGYLLYWSKNLWLPVFAHFVNNAISMIGLSDNRLKEHEFVTGEISPEHLPGFVLFSLLTLGLFILCVRLLYKSCRKED